MNSFDEDYIRPWAKRLDVDDLFDECLCENRRSLCPKYRTREIELLQNELGMIEEDAQARAKFISAMFAANRDVVI